MYLKMSMRHNAATGKHEGYYRLVESYRNIDDRVCHRTILNIGFWDCYSVEQLRRFQYLLNDRIKHGGSELFAYAEEDVVVVDLVKRIYTQLIIEKRIDLGGKEDAKRRDREEKKGVYRIHVDSIRNKDIRELGGEHICYQAIRQLGLPDFLSDLGWSQEQVALAMTQIIARAVYPASEFETARWIRKNSAVCELTGYNIEKITKDKLYGMSKRLFGIKDELEKYLSHRTNTLFDLQDKILIYDLTYAELRIIPTNDRNRLIIIQ